MKIDSLLVLPSHFVASSIKRESWFSVFAACSLFREKEMLSAHRASTVRAGFNLKTPVWLKKQGYWSPKARPGFYASHNLLDGETWYIPMTKEAMDKLYKHLGQDFSGNVPLCVSTYATPFRPIFVDLDGQALQRLTPDHLVTIGSIAVRTVKEFLTDDDGSVDCECIVSHAKDKPLQFTDETTKQVHDGWKFGVHLVFANVIVDHSKQVWWMQAFKDNLDAIQAEDRLELSHDSNASTKLPVMLNIASSMVDDQVVRNSRNSMLRMNRAWKAKPCLACKSVREKRSNKQEELDRLSSVSGKKREELKELLFNLAQTLKDCQPCKGVGKIYERRPYSIHSVINGSSEVLDSERTQFLTETGNEEEEIRATDIRTSRPLTSEFRLDPKRHKAPVSFAYDTNSQQWELKGGGGGSTESTLGKVQGNWQVVQTFAPEQPECVAIMDYIRGCDPKWAQLQQNGFMEWKRPIKCIDTSTDEEKPTIEYDGIGVMGLQVAGIGELACHNIWKQEKRDHTSSRIKFTVHSSGQLFHRCSSRKHECNVFKEELADKLPQSMIAHLFRLESASGWLGRAATNGHVAIDDDIAEEDAIVLTENPFQLHARQKHQKQQQRQQPLQRHSSYVSASASAVSVSDVVCARKTKKRRRIQEHEEPETEVQQQQQQPDDENIATQEGSSSSSSSVPPDSSMQSIDASMLREDLADVEEYDDDKVQNTPENIDEFERNSMLSESDDVDEVPDENEDAQEEEEEEDDNDSCDDGGSQMDANKRPSKRRRKLDATQRLKGGYIAMKDGIDDVRIDQPVLRDGQVEQDMLTSKGTTLHHNFCATQRMYADISKMATLRKSCGVAMALSESVTAKQRALAESNRQSNMDILKEQLERAKRRREVAQQKEVMNTTLLAQVETCESEETREQLKQALRSVIKPTPGDSITTIPYISGELVYRDTSTTQGCHPMVHSLDSWIELEQKRMVKHELLTGRRPADEAKKYFPLMPGESNDAIKKAEEQESSVLARKGGPLTSMSLYRLVHFGAHTRDGNPIPFGISTRADDPFLLEDDFKNKQQADILQPGIPAQFVQTFKAVLENNRKSATLVSTGPAEIPIVQPPEDENEDAVNMSSSKTSSQTKKKGIVTSSNSNSNSKSKDKDQSASTTNKNKNMSMDAFVTRSKFPVPAASSATMELMPSSDVQRHRLEQSQVRQKYGRTIAPAGEYVSAWQAWNLIPERKQSLFGSTTRYALDLIYAENANADMQAFMGDTSQLLKAANFNDQEEEEEQYIGEKADRARERNRRVVRQPF